jgi:hypothetical protein
MSRARIEAVSLVLDIIEGATNEWIGEQILAGHSIEAARDAVRKNEQRIRKLAYPAVNKLEPLLAEFHALEVDAARAWSHYEEGLEQFYLHLARASGRGVMNPNGGWWRC